MPIPVSNLRQEGKAMDPRPIPNSSTGSMAKRLSRACGGRPQHFEPWDLNDLPQCPPSGAVPGQPPLWPRPDRDAATALLLDVILSGRRLRTHVAPMASSLGVTDPQVLANELAAVAVTATLLAADADADDDPMAGEARVLAGRIRWVADQFGTLVALGAVR